jgi:hypothetical protein
MLVWGGNGGNDYWGNELYSFDLRTGTWSRLTEPSQAPPGANELEYFNQDPLADGQPRARSTFDMIEFLPEYGLLWSHGPTLLTWVFDSNTGWSRRANGPGGNELASAYDPATRRIFVHGSGLAVYDVDHDAWSYEPALLSAPYAPRYTAGYEKTAVIDTRRGLLWSVGGRCATAESCRGTVLVWDIARARHVTDEWVTIGAGEYDNQNIVEPDYPEQRFQSGGGLIYYASAPGIDYDSAADDLVAWPNRGAPYALDLETKVWTIGNADGAPGSDNRGTFGRWRYIDAYNVFILINSVDENVYFYKHTSGCGPE